MNITVAVVSRSEGHLLDSVLERVEWADELIVLDMESTDNTVQVAEKYSARVIPVPDAPHAELVRNYGFEAATGDWLLYVDCDEQVPDGYRKELEPILQTTTASAFMIPLVNVAFGHALEYGIGPHKSLRLMRPERVRYPDICPAHTTPHVDGLIEDLTGRVPPFLHHSMTSIDGLLDKWIRYARSEADSLVEAGTCDPWLMFRLFHNNLIVREAWRDGPAGVVSAVLWSWSRGLAHLMAWERLGSPALPDAMPGSAADLSRNVRRFSQRELLKEARRRAEGGRLSAAFTSLKHVATYNPSLWVKSESWKFLAGRSLGSRGRTNARRMVGR
jgi:glycosyltransferase involved in cell wall biosynthesis